MIQFNVDFLGTTVVDKRFSEPMVPWIIADIQRRKIIQKVTLVIENAEIIGKSDDVVIFRHQCQDLKKFFVQPNNMKVFIYLMKDDLEPVLNVYSFQTAEDEDVVEIFQTLRESVRETPSVPKSHSSAATLTSLCPDISPTNSQFFEVLYVGKMKVSHRNVPETFVDDALERIHLLELEKSKRQPTANVLERNKSVEIDGKTTKKDNDANSKNGSSDNSTVLSNNDNNVVKGTSEKSIERKESMAGESNVKDRDESRGNNNIKCATSGEETTDETKSETHSDVCKPEEKCLRPRTGSLGMIETLKKKTDDVNQNRTMLFYVGKTDLRLISPDRKQVLLHKMLKEIHRCIQGIHNNQHFGIISREMDNYVGYVFRCESNNVADHIVSSICQSFMAVKECKGKLKQPILSCDHCPMVWFHKLCTDVEGQNKKKTQLTILKKIESLPEDEQMEIHTKFLGADSSDIKDQNEFLMILLRTHCEKKQIRHVHDTEETRSEFLNQVLGGNTIFMKAKRSLTNSFDHLLKRKGSQSEGFYYKDSESRRSDSTINDYAGHDAYHRSYLTVGPADGEIMKREISRNMSRPQKYKAKRANSESFSGCKELVDVSVNKESEWISCYKEFNDEIDSSKTPLRNIFLKVGSASKTSPQDGSPQEMSHTPSGSWRQAIFNRVVTPGKTEEMTEKVCKKRTKEELRLLWRTAINQQILLIRMEKENARIRAGQEEATVKRIKLEYDELGSSIKEQMGIWDLVCNKDNRISSKCNSQVLLQAVRQGIPRAKRGDVWYYLAHQQCLNESPFDSTGFPNYDIPYEDLLKQLTSCQHTILIDLGRTFPSHPYFSSPLGPGQLALYNLLKAYSLLDPQVGYCQGLSFIAGILLLHMSEDMAFLLLRHLMFRRGLRNQYLPDMAALQVELYQLSRLIHDSLPKLYVHFDKNEIAPTLYATSWMLTLFASQFPLGFVTRVFDLIFMEQTTDVLFRVIIALLSEHKDKLLKLSNFEEIMNYLKNDIPKMDATHVDRIMKKVHTMDISKQLHEFEVEYHVLQEEISTPRVDIERLKKLEVDNKKFREENLALNGQLEALTKSIRLQEEFRINQQNTVNKLEAKVKNLEMTVKLLGDFISETCEEHKDVEIPGDIRRLISNLKTDSVNVKKSFDRSTFFKRIQSKKEMSEKSQIELQSPDDFPGDATKPGNVSKSAKHADQGKPESKPALKGVPLKVIVDENKFEREPSLNLTSKITSGVSSFFNSSHLNAIKNQKNAQEYWANESNSRTDDGAKKSWPEGKFSKDIGPLHIKGLSANSQNKRLIENNEFIPVKKNLEISLPTPTSASPSDFSNNFHPLDSSNGVNITFNGTRKLKTLKSGPQFIRNNAVDLIPVNSRLLHISEDGDP